MGIRILLLSTGQAVALTEPQFPKVVLPLAYHAGRRGHHRGDHRGPLPHSIGGLRGIHDREMREASVATRPGKEW